MKTILLCSKQFILVRMTWLSQQILEQFMNKQHNISLTTDC